MKALRIENPDHATLVDLTLSEPKDREILIKVMACGICGTDIRIFRGDYFGEYPIVPGHEFSGIIEQTGDGVARFQTGDHVAIEPNISCDNCYNCLNNRQNFCENWQAIGVTLQGGMAQYILVPEKSAFKIGELPFAHGAFVEPLSCVIHGLEKVRISLGDRVVILGAGPIGNLFLQLTRLQGAGFVSVLEQQPSRIELAEKFGADRVVNKIDDLKQDDFDVVIDATGNIKLMERTVDLVRRGGSVLLFGVPSTGEMMAIEAIKIFKKGLTLLSSFTSVRNSYQAISLLQTGEIEVAELISHKLPLIDFEKSVEMIEGGFDNVKKVILLPQE